MPCQKPAALDLIQLHHRLLALPGVQDANVTSWLEQGLLYLKFRLLYRTPRLDEAEHLEFTLVRDIRVVHATDNPRLMREILGQLQGMIMSVVAG